MINLIPPDARRAVTKEYWLRVITVWLWLGAVGFFIIAIFNIPTYVLIESQLNVFTDQYNEAQLKQDEFKRSEEEIKTTNSLVSHLSVTSTSTPYTEYLDGLDQLARSGIEITRFSFNTDAGVVASINVNGVAIDRAALTNFSDNVEAHPLFSTAQIPIANLAKDKDISFNITIVASKDESS